MKVISIVNNKGGVGKTTTTHNLGVAIAKQGYQVALIDFDAQANLSFALQHEPKKYLEDIIQSGGKLTKEDFSSTNVEGLYLLPNRNQITSSTFEGMNPLKKVNFLKTALTTLKDIDFVLIDTPPDLDIEVFASLGASSHVLIVIEYAPFALLGITKLLENVEDVKTSGINPDLEILGVLATKVDQRMSLNQDIESSLQETFKKKILKSKIRTSSKFDQAQSDRQNIFDFGDPKGSEDYQNLALEILAKLK
jgi:chromosome partitioning protein